MTTKPVRTFLLGTCLGVGALIGLAPSTSAQPARPDPVLTSPTTPPSTATPGDDGCAPVNCDRPDDLADPCSLHPESCTPDTTPPPDGDPGEPDQADQADQPSNPDVVVVRTPRFTG